MHIVLILFDCLKKSVKKYEFMSQNKQIQKDKFHTDFQISKMIRIILRTELTNLLNNKQRTMLSIHLLKEWMLFGIFRRRLLVFHIFVWFVTVNAFLLKAQRPEKKEKETHSDIFMSKIVLFLLF